MLEYLYVCKQGSKLTIHENRIGKMIDPKEDSLRIYKLGDCKGTSLYGKNIVVGSDSYAIV